MVMAHTQARRMLTQIPLVERTGISALAGGVAGGFVSATLHPIDTVKTKLQARGASEVYSGPFDVVAKVLSVLSFLVSACMQHMELTYRIQMYVLCFSLANHGCLLCKMCIFVL